MNHLLEQLKLKAIPIFEVIFLTCIDNNSNHAAFLSYALLANKMNLFSGEKQPAMQSTTWEDNNQQDMCFPDDYFDEKLRKKPKGINKYFSKEENGGIV